MDANERQPNEKDDAQDGESSPETVSPVDPGSIPDDSELQGWDGDEFDSDGEDVSLESLSRAYAKVIAEQAGSTSNEVAVDTDETPSTDGLDVTKEQSEQLADLDDGDHDFPVSPSSILEALLFVGLPENQPISSRRAASLMRDVAPKEIDQLVEKLNKRYAKDGAAYRIVASGKGFELKLADEMSVVREKFQGAVRDARLSQAAIEVLAVVAYNQPVSREDVDKLRLHSSGAILNQLVRRDLLKVERSPANKRIKQYLITGRFLDLFAMKSIGDLPHAELDDSL